MHLGARQDRTRLHARAWSQEELDTLGEALDDVVQRLGDGFSYKEVEAKFRELNPGTPRSYKGILEQAKKRLVASSPEQPAMAGVLTVRTAAAQRLSPTLTLAQMAAEVLSVRPNMQAGRDEVFAAVGGHPIYAHTLSWKPSHDPRFDFSWKPTLQKTLSEKKPFAANKAVDANGRRVYQLDTTASYGRFWKAAPLVLASLLATYLPENKATAEELAAALVGHPLFKEVLAAENGTTDKLTPGRFVAQVERVLASLPEIYTVVPQPKGYKGPAVYSAVLKPLPPR